MKFSICFSIFVICLSTTAYSKVRIDKQVIEDAHRYIINHSDLFAQMDKKYPGVADKYQFRVLSYDQLQKNYHGENADGLIEVTAYYDPKTNVTYFHDQFDTSTLKGRAVILHEYVHFLQFNYGLDQLFSCSYEVEYDAYKIQADYLVDHGMDKNSSFVENLNMSAFIFLNCNVNL